MSNNEIAEVPGLFYFPKYFADFDCFQKLQNEIWNLSLERRTIHYGVRYDYPTRKLVYDAVPFSPWISNLANNLYQLFGVNFNQCIINEYLSNQKISPHIDAKCFGDKIVTISFGSTMTMRMSYNNQKINIPLENGDLILLSGEARHLFKHELLPVKNSNFYRVSITFRTII